MEKVMPLLRLRKNRQEKIATVLFGLFITAPIWLIFLPKHNATIIIVFSLMGIAGFYSAYLKHHYGTWRQQYDEALFELGYEKVSQGDNCGLGVYRKDGVNYTIYLMRKGVMSVRLKNFF